MTIPKVPNRIRPTVSLLQLSCNKICLSALEESNDVASSLVTHLASEGVLTSAVGDVVKMKPSLLLGEHQVSELVGAIAKF